jgi:AraC-like DNA-binding protein
MIGILMLCTPRRPTLCADPLGETLHLLQLIGTLYCRAELTAPWGVEFPRLEGLMTFQVVTEGSCWLELQGQEPRQLRPGNLILIPHGTPYVLRSSPNARAEPLFEIPVEHVSERYEIMRYGGGGASTQITCGVVRFDQVAAERLIKALPEVLWLDAWSTGDGWLQSLLQLITREATALRPGGETVITRLADVIIIQVIRGWLDSAPEAQRGWFSALRDPQIGSSLAAIHRAPQLPWTVDALASEVGMSRSAFSARFTELVGSPPVRYLTEWRLQLARLELQRSSEPLAALAARFGYQSEAAFSRAFSREFGAAPGSFRRERPYAG